MATSIKNNWPETTNEDHTTPRITGFSVVASYNWLDTLTPTILIPGLLCLYRSNTPFHSLLHSPGIPPIWTPPRLPPALSPDSGSRYVDQNADRNPGSPLESLVSAVNTLQPDFNFSQINVITDRRPIRKLFGFVSGEHGKSEFGPATGFKFGVQIMENGSAMLTRIEEESRECVKAGEKHNLQCYRQAFEHAYTKIPAWAEESTSHHRIVSYKLGGLSFLVRYAVDGYVDDAVGSKSSGGKTDNTTVDDLVGYLKATALDHPAPTGNNAFNKRVTVVKGGKDVLHKATFELATRKVTTRFELDERLVDLWISQTPRFVTCRYRVEYHKRSAPKARFNEITMTDVQPKLTEWEEKNAETIKKLVSALKEILDSARHMDGHCIVSYSGEEGASLMIEAVGEGRMPSLSPKTKVLFKNQA